MILTVLSTAGTFIVLHYVEVPNYIWWIIGIGGGMDLRYTIDKWTN
jgi:hypothetical protein